MIIIKKNEIFVRDTLVGLEEISRRKHFICIVHSFITRTQLWLMLWNTIILIHTRGLNWQIISLLVDVRRKPAILFCGLPHVGRQRDQGYRIQADYNVLRLIVYISFVNNKNYYLSISFSILHHNDGTRDWLPKSTTVL